MKILMKVIVIIWYIICEDFLAAIKHGRFIVLVYLDLTQKE